MHEHVYLNCGKPIQASFISPRQVVSFQMALAVLNVIKMTSCTKWLREGAETPPIFSHFQIGFAVLIGLDGGQERLVGNHRSIDGKRQQAFMLIEPCRQRKSYLCRVHKSLTSRAMFAKGSTTNG